MTICLTTAAGIADIAQTSRCTDVTTRAPNDPKMTLNTLGPRVRHVSGTSTPESQIFSQFPAVFD